MLSAPLQVLAALVVLRLVDVYVPAGATGFALFRLHINPD